MSAEDKLQAEKLSLQEAEKEGDRALEALLAALVDDLPGRVSLAARHIVTSQSAHTAILGEVSARALRDRLAEETGAPISRVREAASKIKWPHRNPDGKREWDSVSQLDGCLDQATAEVYKVALLLLRSAGYAVFERHGTSGDVTGRPNVLPSLKPYDDETFAQLVTDYQEAAGLCDKARGRVSAAKRAVDDEFAAKIWDT